MFLCWEVFDSWVNLLNSFSLDLMQHFLSVLGHEERSPSTTPVTRVSAVSRVTFHITCYTGQRSVPCHLPRHLLHRSAQCPLSPSTTPVTRVSAVSQRKDMLPSDTEQFLWHYESLVVVGMRYNNLSFILKGVAWHASIRPLKLR